MTTISVFAGDTHGGSMSGLCLPETPMGDGAVYRANSVQVALYNMWRRFWKDIFPGIANRYAADRFYLFTTGDLAEGDHHGTTQLVTANPLWQDDVAMGPWLEIVPKPDRVYAVRGTEAHVGASSWRDESLARRMGNAGWPVQVNDVDGSASSWVWYTDVDGVAIMAAHHGKAGGLPWTKAGAPARYGLEVASQWWTKWKKPPPDLCVFGHTHKFDHSGFHYGRPEVWVNACWQSSTAYGHKIKPGVGTDIGLLIFVTGHGEIINRDPRIIFVESEPSYHGRG